MAESVHDAPHAEAHHEELGFWRKYIFSTDHKVIGIQFMLTGLVFFVLGLVAWVGHTIATVQVEPDTPAEPDATPDARTS